jgi:hypothetical protein
MESLIFEKGDYETASRFLEAVRLEVEALYGEHSEMVMLELNSSCDTLVIYLAPNGYAMDQARKNCM